MRSLRLYIEKPLDEGFKVLLKDDSFHYLSKVLKAKVNQEVVLFNNTGYDFFGYIKDIAAKHFEIYIEHKVFSEKEVFLNELLKNEGMTLINIWASWCIPCRDEHP